MPSFADSIFLFILALLLFGPKKLPVLARELGKWMGEFRRASNEFKMQMEDELRASEQTERQKQIAAMEAAAPIPPPLDEPAEPEHPHLRHSAVAPENTILAPEPSMLAPEPTLLAPQAVPDAIGQVATASTHAAEPVESSHPEIENRPPDRREGLPYPPDAATRPSANTSTADGVRPVPIATSGSLNMMPPTTGLPTPRTRGGNGALSSLVDSIPEAPPETPAGTHETESLAHGD